MSRTLLVRPLPKPGQSVECYVRQLAEQNGYSSGATMLKNIIGISGGRADTISLNQLELLTGNDSGVLNAAQLTLVEEREVRHFRFHDMTLPSYHLRREEWICPHCYEDCGYVMASWRIAWLPACTEHECALVPLKTEDRRRQGPETYDLFFHRGENNDALPADVLEVQSWLERKLFAEATSSSPTKADIVATIDDYLVRALRLQGIGELQHRKRRYRMMHFPLNHAKTMKFMSCLHSQLLAPTGSS